MFEIFTIQFNILKGKDDVFQLNENISFVILNVLFFFKVREVEEEGGVEKIKVMY